MHPPDIFIWRGDRPYQGRSVCGIIGAIGASWTYISQNMSPMMRYAHAVGSHSYRTLSAVAIFLWTSSPCWPHPTTKLSTPASQACLSIGNGDRPCKSPGLEQWRLICNREQTWPGLIGFTETRWDSYVISDTLLTRVMRYKINVKAQHIKKWRNETDTKHAPSLAETPAHCLSSLQTSVDRCASRRRKRAESECTNSRDGRRRV